MISITFYDQRKWQIYCSKHVIKTKANKLKQGIPSHLQIDKIPRQEISTNFQYVKNLKQKFPVRYFKSFSSTKELLDL